MSSAPARLLIIAGSDSSGGAGVQADIKTATALGVYAAAAVTAVTAQDTLGVHAVHHVPASIIRDQTACVLADIGADAIKIGMLGSAAAVDAVSEILGPKARHIPIVLDPVLQSTSGSPLLEQGAVSILKERLFPAVTLLTPNIPEASALTGIAINGTDAMCRAGEELRRFGAKAVLVKGGHSSGEHIDDVLVDERGERVFSAARIESRNTHGTGCSLSTAIACGLAQGLSLVDSIHRARAFVRQAIATAHDLGHGRGPLNHLI